MIEGDQVVQRECHEIDEDQEKLQALKMPESGKVLGDP